jgi:hypothetical protein
MAVVTEFVFIVGFLVNYLQSKVGLILFLSIEEYVVSESLHLEKLMFPSLVPLVCQACRSCETRLFPSRRTLVP